MNSSSTTLDSREVEKFAPLAQDWWDPNGPFAPLHAMNPLRLEVIRREAETHLPLQPGPRPFAGLNALDVGCGGGLATEALARLGAATTGLDAGEDAIAAASSHAAAMGLPIRYLCDTAEALAEREPGRFNLITALEVVEHVADIDAFLQSLANLAAPGALIVLSTLNRTAKAFALGIVAAERILKWAPVGAHDFDKFVTPSELAAALRRAGFEPSAPQGVSYAPLSRRWKLSLDCDINYMMSGMRNS
jgi:2-polyprenyl-6-hydroxyphenyl methylase/3-demethylubiquinone-9 3-methyltransferase